MNLFIDVHTVLATPEDMDDWHEDADEAAEKLNVMLHRLADQCAEDDSANRFEQFCQTIWEHWHKDALLPEIDESDLTDWVDQQLATWDDAGSLQSQADYVPE